MSIARINVIYTGNQDLALELKITALAEECHGFISGFGCRAGPPPEQDLEYSFQDNQDVHKFKSRAGAEIGSARVLDRRRAGQMDEPITPLLLGVAGSQGAGSQAMQPTPCSDIPAEPV